MTSPSSFDISDTLAPNSDQLDAVDLLGGPATFTVKSVAKGSAEQPVNIHLAEFPRPWRPGKSMRRVLVACWGKDASQYVGRRLKLWCDPTVRFGGVDVGGVRILELSHIDKPQTIPLLVTRGKSAPYKVQPLVEEAPKPPADQGVNAAKSRLWEASKVAYPDLSDEDRRELVTGTIKDRGIDLGDPWQVDELEKEWST